MIILVTGCRNFLCETIKKGYSTELRTDDTEVLNLVKGFREDEWRFVIATEILIMILFLIVMCSI